MRIRALVVAVLAFALVAGPASAKTYLPPAGKVWNGVTGNVPLTQYQAQTGKHPAVWQFFMNWGSRLDSWFAQARVAQSRPMFHITTGTPGHEAISPGAIAAGQGDGYLVTVNRAIAASGQITYIRLLAEMDGYWNAYCAYNQNGSSRGKAHSTSAFRQAWRRAVLIVRGGPIAAINSKLKKLHMPPVRGASGSLARAPVAFMWVPQVAGAPDTAANAPSAYWPGAAYVDWVGTDFYSKFPNWAGLERFYSHSYGKPFVFGEWALWGSDNPGFVHQLFSWARSHGRVRMLSYNQGNRTSGPFQLKLYPKGRQAIRQELGSARFPAFAPELTKPLGDLPLE
jgi:hypothetical protein